MSEVPLFDRRVMRRWRARARRHGGRHFLAERISRDVADRVAEVNRGFSRMLEIAAVPGAIATPLIAEAKVGEAVIGLVAPAPEGPVRRQVAIDEEALPFAPSSFDLVAGALTLHGVNDLPGTLAQINRVLVPDGLFVAALFGGATLSELRQSFAAAEAEISGGSSPRVMPFTDLRDAGGLLQRAGFALAVADADRFTVRYDSALALIADVRAMGEANALAERSRTPLTRGLLARMAEIYAERFADADGRVRATFEIVTVTGWRAHDSQQRPLRPGSARMKLADALGTGERSAGERARPGFWKRSR